MDTSVVDWLLASSEPWTRYRTLLDLLHRQPADPDVKTARHEMLAHPQVRNLIKTAAAWPGTTPLKRHNDAGHPLYAISTLADFGLRHDDPGLADGVSTILSHISAEGSFQSMLLVPKSFGGTGESAWSWMLCDCPTLLYSLLAMGVVDDPRIQMALDHLIGLADDNGWRCRVAPELGGFRGPGRKDDPCPIANVYGLKALAQTADLIDSQAARRGVEMLLGHWERQADRKLYLFGIGTTYRRFKYPFVWYDILHVADVLSRFPNAAVDPRFGEMVETITAQANNDGLYTAGSMFQPWKEWSFGDKKRPSPWLTFLILRIQHRVSALTLK